jgi:hypothetical protein
MAEKKTTEEFRVDGEELLAKVKELIKAGKELITIPVTAGVVLAVLAPVLAAVGAIAALVTECTIVVEREAEEGKR